MSPEADPYEVEAAPEVEDEAVDGELVLAPLAALASHDAERLPLRLTPPAFAAAAAAAGGFVVGAATVALLRRYAQARLEPAASPLALDQQLPGQTRAYLVHVRRLG